MIFLGHLESRGSSSLQRSSGLWIPDSGHNLELKKKLHKKCMETIDRKKYDKKPPIFVLEIYKICVDQGENFNNRSGGTGRNFSPMHFTRILFMVRSTFLYIFDIIFF